MNEMPVFQDDPSLADCMKRVLCEVEVPFLTTFQERVLLFSLLDQVVQSLRAGEPEFVARFGIQPSAFAVLDVLHGKFVKSFHGGGIPYKEARAAFPQDYPNQP